MDGEADEEWQDLCIFHSFHLAFVIAACPECLKDLEGMEPELQMEEDSEVGGRWQVAGDRHDSKG